MKQNQDRNSLGQALLGQKRSSKQSSKIEQQLDSAQKSYKQKYIKANHQLLHGNIFGLTFFKWISPLLRYGNKISISEDVMPTLGQELDVKHDFNSLNSKFKSAKKSSIKGLTLTKALAATFSRTLLKIGIFVFLVISLQMYSPLLINQIMDYIKEDSQKRDQTNGIILFLVATFLMFTKCISENHMYFNFGLLGFNTSNTVNLMIYTKSLKYPALCQKKHTIAEIINYTQVDAQRLTDIGFMMSMIFLAPIEMAIGIYLMVSFLGLAFLSGLAVIVAVTILTFFIQQYAAKINDNLLKAKDARVKLTEQIFNIIRFIKTNAMEKYFFRKVNSKRMSQLKLSKTNQMMWVLMYLIYFVTSPLVMSLTFATFTWMGNQMTSNVAFTTLLIFRLLQFPITMFPIAIGEVIQIWSSMKRVEDFLMADQLHFQCISYLQDNPKDKNAIKITNGTFQWGLQEKKDEQQKDEQTKQIKKQHNDTNKAIKSEEKLKQSLLSQNISEQLMVSVNQQGQKSEHKQQKATTIIALHDINLQFTKSKFTMILGDIGSGKSSLLYAILNEMQPTDKSKARIQVNGSLAFVSQKAWIMSSSFKDNITFTLPYSQHRFEKVIRYASLEKDIQGMTDGIETQIGEKGVNLSGGQKARISLARALYSKRDIYLLDDVISAVDVHVGRFLMKQTIVQFLRGKTVILATHAIAFAQYADQILIMKKGKVVHKGTYKQVAQTEQFKQLNQIQNQRQRKKSEQKQEQDQKQQEQMDKLANKYSKSNSKQKSVDKVKIIESGKQKVQTQTQKLVYELMLPEEQKKGTVQWKIYQSYIKLNGGALFVIGLVLSSATWVVLYSLSNIQMEKWCEDPESSQYHLYLFLGLSISGSVLAFLRILILVLAGLKQSATIHKKMIKALLYASVPDFFNRVPIGRIINRLTKDLRVIDQNLSYTVQGFIGSAFSLLGSFVICVYASSPLLIIPIVFMVISCIYIKKYYMKTQRQVVRLEAISNSPIMSGLISTVNGLAVIRSYNIQDKFIEEQIKKINRNKQIRLSKDSLQGWFAQRLSLLSFIVNITAIAFCLLSSNQNASLVGLLMSYAITLNDDIIGLMFCVAGVENQMVSYERIINFVEIEPEPGYIEYCKKWRTGEEQRNTEAIQKGKIRFENYGIRYRHDLPFVLKNVNLSIKEGEKVGIVGRTGAGKSTIISCLIRILEPTQGRILIDDQNIMDYHLRDLRSCITMIEQEPTLINGTFKENLDPGHRYSVEELNGIIKECNLQETINERGGIQSQISNDSLSVGEKQLLCICRAFLKKSKIVLIDEATANIDMKNDALIQEVIQKKFTQSTVLTIAHRLSTLRNVDKILVLGEGKVLEWGSPNDLLNKQDGIYRAMVDSNNEDFLK